MGKDEKLNVFLCVCPCVCVCECVTLDLIRRRKQSVKKLQRARLCAGHVINFLFLVFKTSVLFVIARKNAIYLFVYYRLKRLSMR